MITVSAHPIRRGAPLALVGERRIVSLLALLQSGVPFVVVGQLERINDAAIWSVRRCGWYVSIGRIFFAE